MPYITATIIVQLLTVVIPRFEALKKEGQAGQTKMTQYSRYLTIGLAILQSATLITFARNPSQIFGPNCTEILTDTNVSTILMMVLTLTAGTGLIMWLGELITDRGIGNGMSLLIFTSIAAGFPSSLWAIQQQEGRWDVFIGVILVGFFVMALVIFVEQSQRRIPVQYAKRQVGRRMYGGSSTYIPLKVNMAGVIPVIFASSLLALPALVAQFATPQDGSLPPDWVIFVQSNLVQGDSALYMAVYVALILFFTFFYVSITFNPVEVADNMKRYGGFIPGIRAGRPTAEYLDYVLTRITVPGAIYLAAISLIPLIALKLFNANQNFPFGGTSILIIVGVGLETVKQIQAQLQQRNYEGFLR
jgi:preprotein translocase subunit SecY